MSRSILKNRLASRGKVSIGGKVVERSFRALLLEMRVLAGKGLLKTALNRGGSIPKAFVEKSLNHLLDRDERRQARERRDTESSKPFPLFTEILWDALQAAGFAGISRKGNILCAHSVDKTLYRHWEVHEGSHGAYTMVLDHFRRYTERRHVGVIIPVTYRKFIFSAGGGGSEESRIVTIPSGYHAEKAVRYSSHRFGNILGWDFVKRVRELPEREQGAWPANLSVHIRTTGAAFQTIVHLRNEAYHLPWVRKEPKVGSKAFAANIEDAIERIRTRRAKAAADLLAQRLEKKNGNDIAKQVYVEYEDSVNAGNCLPETDAFVEKIRGMGFGFPVALRGDFLLGLRDDAYTRRAIAQAYARMRRERAA